MSKAVGIKLTTYRHSDYVDLNNWQPMASKLDWSIINGLRHWFVLVKYDDGTYRELCKIFANSTHCGDYARRIYCDGKESAKLVLSADAIIPTVRLFVSVAVSRGVSDETPVLVITPEV